MDFLWRTSNCYGTWRNTAPLDCHSIYDNALLEKEPTCRILTSAIPIVDIICIGTQLCYISNELTNVYSGLINRVF